MKSSYSLPPSVNKDLWCDERFTFSFTRQQNIWRLIIDWLIDWFSLRFFSTLLYCQNNLTLKIFILLSYLRLFENPRHFFFHEICVLKQQIARTPIPYTQYLFKNVLQGQKALNKSKVKTSLRFEKAKVPLFQMLSFRTNREHFKISLDSLIKIGRR